MAGLKCKNTYLGTLSLDSQFRAKVKFPVPRYLKQHVMSVHESDRYHKCNQCDRYFTKPYKLKNHIEYVHEQTKNFKCDYCGKLFTQSSNLNKHVRFVHRKEKKFNCDICQKAFPELGHLETHFLTKSHIDQVTHKQSNSESQ